VKELLELSHKSLNASYSVRAGVASFCENKGIYTFVFVRQTTFRLIKGIYTFVSVQQTIFCLIKGIYTFVFTRQTTFHQIKGIYTFLFAQQTTFCQFKGPPLSPPGTCFPYLSNAKGGVRRPQPCNPA
jgi:hypothetical protein